MPAEIERPQTWLDSAALTLALAGGIGWAWASWPILFALSQRNEPDFFHIDINPTAAAQQSYMLLSMMALTMAPPTAVVVILRCRRPRPRRWFGQPGVVACLAASVVILAELSRYFVRKWTLFAELMRIQGDVRGNIVQLPRQRDLDDFLGLAGAIGHRAGEHAGLAVFGVFLAWWASRIPSGGPSWLDRIGRLLGFFWIVVTLGFLLKPVPWE